MAVTALFASSVLAAVPLAEAQPTATTPTFKVTERDGVTALTKMYGSGHAYVSVTLLASTPACPEPPTTPPTTACFPSGFPSDERDILPGGLEIKAGTTTPDIIKIDLLETGAETLTFVGSFGAWFFNENYDTDGDPGTVAGTGDRTNDDDVNENLLFLSKIAGNTANPAQLLGRARVHAQPKIENDIELRLPQWPAAASAALYKLTWIPAADGQLRDFQGEARQPSLSHEGPHPTPPFDPALNAVFDPALNADDVPILGWQDKVFYTVTDDDLNSRPTALDSGTIRVWSDSDLVGETRTVTETGVNTGVFHTNVGFEPTFSANNGLVFVRHGDKVYAQYVDTRDANGASQTPQPIERLFLSLSNANLAFSVASAAGLLIGNALGGTRNNVTLSLIDPDMDVSIRSEFVEATILDGATGVCRAQLHQVGGPTGGATAGVYMATLAFANASDIPTLAALPGFTPESGPASDRACASFRGASVIPLGATTTTVRHTITAKYADQDLNNQLQQRTATMVWIPATTGDLILGGDDAPKRFAGTVQSATLRLIDPDRDFNPTLIDSVTVQVRSDSDPVTGISVTLTESGASTGDFSGSLSFTTEASGGSILRVSDGDRVRADYRDLTGANGRPATVSSAPAVWRSARTAVVTADQTEYFYALAATNPQPGGFNPNNPSTFNPRPDTFARIVVEDQDQNDPRVQDRLRVLAVPILPAGERGVSLELTEIGVNSGIFEGVLPFTLDFNDKDPKRLFVGDRDTAGSRTFRIEYADPVSASGFPGLATSPTLTFRLITNPNVRIMRTEIVELAPAAEEAGLIRFRAKDVVLAPGRGNNCCGSAFVTVAVYTAPAVNVKPVIELSSNRCVEPRAFDLEDGDTGTGTSSGAGQGGATGDGRWGLVVATRTFNDNDNCNNFNHIGISRPDAVIVRAGQGVQATLAIRADSSSQTTDLFNAAGQAIGTGVRNLTTEQTPTLMRVTSVRDNHNRNIRELAPVSVRSLTDPFPRRVWLYETGPDTSQFEGGFSAVTPVNFVPPASPRTTVRLTTGAAVADAVIPGPLGDTCSSPPTPPPPSVVVAPGAAASEVAGLSCFEIQRTMPDGTVSTFAVAATPTGGAVRLGTGFVVGPMGIGGRCFQAPNELVGTFSPAFSVGASSGVFHCAEIDITTSSGPLRAAYGEPAREAIGTARADAEESDAQDAGTSVRLTTSTSVRSDPYVNGAIGNVCSGGTSFGAGASITAAQETTIRCFEITRTLLGGRIESQAFSIEIDPDDEGEVPNADDPLVIRFSRSFLNGQPDSPGSGARCGADTVPPVLVFDGLDGVTLPLAGTFTCVEISLDPFDLNPEVDPDEELDFWALGQRRIASFLVTNGPLFEDSTNPGPLGSSCTAGSSLASLPGSGAVPSGLSCVQANVTLLDGTRFTMALPVNPAGVSHTRLRLASGFVEGLQGRFGTCGPAAATIFSVVLDSGPPPPAVSAMPAGIPTCAEVAYGTLVAGNFVPSQTFAAGYERRDSHQVLVRSALVRATNPEQADVPNYGFSPTAAINRDFILVSGRGSRGAAFYDGGGRVQIANDPVGLQASLDLRLVGDDLLSRRVVGEVYSTTSSTQRVFNIRQAYVPGSEFVYDTGSQTGPTFVDPLGTDIHFALHPRTGGAFESVYDRNYDGRLSCGDVDYDGGTEVLSGGCGTTGVEGFIDYNCSAECGGGPSIAYSYRLAFNPSPPAALPAGVPANTVYQYARPNMTQIRFGSQLCPPAHPRTTACDTAAQFMMDYTPAIQFVTLVSTPLTGAGETEVVQVRWEPVSGDYRAVIPLETFRTPNNGRLFVAGSTTTITARFDDAVGDLGVPTPNNAADYRAAATQALWRRGEDATISFHTPDFSETLSNQAFGAAIPLQIRDVDADRTTQQDHVVVRASNAANPGAFVDVVLRETSSSSGVFRGYVPVKVVTEGAGIVGVEMPAAGGTVVVRYEENAGASGIPSVVTATIPWKPSQTGAVQVFRDVNRLFGVGANPPHDFFQGNDANMFIRVTDADRNLNSAILETIQVVVVSDGEPEGETVVLRERAGFPGVFDSSAVQFEKAKTLGNGKIFARDDGFNQDAVWVRYFDPLNLEGRQAQIEGVRFSWDATDDGEVSFDFDEYIGVFNEVGSGTRRHAVVAVADGDCNLKPNVVDIIDDTERENCGPIDGSIDAPDAGFCIRVIQPATPADCDPDDTGVLRPVRLVETGANTGVFVGVVSFRTTAGPAPGTATTINGLPVTVQNADRIRAHWGDSFTAAGEATSPFFFTDEARWHQKGFGVLSFNATAVTGIADKVMLQLIDADLDKAGANNVHAVNTTVVKVDSNALATPLDVTLTETGINTGIFRKELSISLESSNAANGIIRVQKVDTITASYADASPPGTRTQSLIVNLEDRLPPVTTLHLQDAAIGENNVFLEPVTVSLTATDESGVREIGFLFGSATAYTVYQNPFVLGAGEHVITYRAIDVLGREEAPKNETIEVDVSNPTQVPTGLTATAIAAGHIQLNWTQVANTVNPFEFNEYAVYRDGLLAHIGNTTAAGFVDDNLTDENPHSYRLAVRDRSGRAGPFTPSVTVTPDATAPILAGALVEPSQFDIRFKPSGGLNVSVSVSDLGLQSVRASLELPGGEVVDAQALVLQANGRHGATLSLDNLTVPCSCVVEFTATDLVGNEGTLTVDLFVSGPDLTAPQARLDIAGGQLPVGTPLNVVVTDNVAVASVSYRLDGGPTVVVPVPEPTPSVSFVVPAQLLSLGAHSIVVNATDNATDENGTADPNGASIPLNFEVVVGGGGPGVPASFFLPTRARALANGSVLVEWDVPAEIVGVGGFQVWRAASPFALIGNITDPDARSFLDTSAIPGTVYKYVVTFFTGAPFAALGQVPGYPGNDDAVQASAPVEAGEEGRPTWLWYLLGALAFVAVVVLIAALVASRRGGGRQQAVLEAPPPPPPAVEGEPAGEREAWAQTHRLRCPECGHRFEVSGTKPIVTNCPNCGRKGILR